jgi:hypothetical protein
MIIFIDIYVIGCDPFKSGKLLTKNQTGIY